MSTKQRLLFITTGGTIASVRTQQGLKPVLTSEELLAHLPELNELCCPDTLALCSIDSTDLGPEHWLMMAKAVQENYALYDGFIICHGTDTLAYSAAALSYLIQNADKPVILTGAQQPISNEITDARKTFATASSAPLTPAAGASWWCSAAMSSQHPRQEEQDHQLRRLCLGEFPGAGTGTGRPSGAVCAFALAHRPCGVWTLAQPPRLSAQADARPQPRFDPRHFPPLRLRHRGELRRRRHPPAADERLRRGPRRLRQDHKVLILTTQVTYEGSDVGIYEVGKRVKNRFRFLEAHDMTIEAVVTKIMWLLAQDCDSFDQLQQRFYRQVNFDTFYH